MAEEKQKCETMFMSGWNRVRCSKNATSEVDGKHFCGTHDPIKRIARERKKQDEWNKEYERKKEIAEYKEASVEYCKKRGLTIEDLNDAVHAKGETNGK